MAVLPMKRISICALKANRKAILEELQRKGVIEITDVIDEDEIFKRNDLSEIQSVFTKNIQTAENALEILNTHVREKTGLLSSFEGRTISSPEQYSEFDTKRASTLEAAQTLVSLSKSCKGKEAVSKGFKITRDLSWTRFRKHCFAPSV